MRITKPLNWLKQLLSPTQPRPPMDDRFRKVAGEILIEQLDPRIDRPHLILVLVRDSRDVHVLSQTLRSWRSRVISITHETNLSEVGNEICKLATGNKDLYVVATKQMVLSGWSVDTKHFKPCYLSQIQLTENEWIQFRARVRNF